MARNATILLTGDALERSNYYASIVESYVGDESGSTVCFNYTSRTGEVGDREAQVVEIVGQAGMSSHGFKGMTDAGPRTFNFHLMG